MTRVGLLLIACALTSLLCLPAKSQALMRAEPNDHREAAGRIIERELRINLEVIEAEWFPRGPDGPRFVIPAFAEVGRAPQVPGPLIRAGAGTPIYVTIRNGLSRPIAVRGLIDRASMPSSNIPPDAGPFPGFAFSEPLIIDPGETGETRFSPSVPVTSFYYAQVLPNGAGPEAARPFGSVEEGGFMGALVIDPPHNPPADERVLMITRWGSPGDPDLQISWKMMLNGRSWPFTERLEYTVGDTVRWRVINASLVDHPMHLHGFYFTVEGEGDTETDIVYRADERTDAVTQMMQEFSSLRLAWVPEQPGNWLFHCHLIRHMGGIQRIDEDAPSASAHGDGGQPSMDAMAGLIAGITVHSATDAELTEEAPARRLDLWTSERPDVYDGHPELAFLVQTGPEPPPVDSTRVPSSPLVLTRGEPTEIVVHNRFDFPLSVHWHGLELRSLYDGVGGWSGYPGSVRPPIPPNDSVRVLITPPKSGTFIYHVHGEAGHELSQGLYGPFLVIEPGRQWNPDADRVYALASRGAERDAAPVVNGCTLCDPERFELGRTYRLRFLHISADAFKEVRLLRDGELDRWRPLAKDGADLPAALQRSGPSRIGIGVGETYDVEWKPSGAGLYVLEVTTEFYPAVGGSVTQRIPFAVGEVSDAELDLQQSDDLRLVPLSAEERGRYTGTFLGTPSAQRGEPIELILTVWEKEEGLYTNGIVVRGNDDSGKPDRFFPLGKYTFARGRDLEGLIHAGDLRYHFAESDEGFDFIAIKSGGRVVAELARVDELELAEADKDRFAGEYRSSAASGAVTVTLDGGMLKWTDEDGRTGRLIAISPTRFKLEGRPSLRVHFKTEGRQVVALTLESSTGKSTRFARRF